MSGKGKKITKFLGWFFLVVIILFFTTLAFLWVRAPEYLKANLSQIVAEKSDGLYHVAFTDIQLKFLPLSFYIDDFSLYPDEKVAKQISQTSPDQIIYSFQSPEIQFQKINPVALIKNRNFKCARLRIVTPVLKLSGEQVLQNDSVKALENVFYEMRPLFQKYLREISIKDIEFADAQYALYGAVSDSAQISKADQISVEIKNFKTDSSMIFSETDFFDTEDILIRMANFHNEMGDSLHTVKIDTLQYSLKTSDISAAGFHLTAGERDSTKNIYDVHVPRFYMKSKSITRFSFNDSLKIQYLEFVQPQIKFYQKKNHRKLQIEDLTNFDLYTLIQNQFPRIEIDSFYLTNANIEIFRQPDFNNYQQQFRSVNVTLNGFELDSASARNQQKLLHADDLEMLVSGYHLRLEDNEHDFRADSLFVSTFTNSLGARKLNIRPANSAGIGTRTVVRIDCDALDIENVDLKKLYHTRILPTSKIEISNPNVHLQYHTERKKNKKQREAGLLFDLVSAYLQGVYSNLVYIEDGVLNIENLYKNNLRGYFETKFNFSLTDFSLDSASVERTDKFFYATNFDLRFADYNMKLVDNLHKLDVDSIYISSIDQRVQINNLLLQPVIKNVTDEIMEKYNRSELYNIFVPRIDLYGIQLRNAFFYNKLSMQNFKISNPKIYFENFGALRATKEKKEFTEFYQLIFNYLYDFDIKKITVPHGEITWVNHTKKGKTTSFDNEFSAALENFRLNEEELDKKRLLFSDNFDISVKDQLFQLSDSVHILRAGEINLSSEKSSISVKDALLYPVITSPKYKDLTTTFQVSIPELKISNFDFLEAYYSKELNVENLDINNPKFQIYSQPGTFKSLDLKKYKFPMPAFIRSLQLDKLRINNGQVMTFETQGLNHIAKSSFKINLTMPGFSLENNEQKQAQINSENLILDISAFNSPIGKNHTISIGQIGFNRSGKSISISNLKVNPFLPKPDENQFTIVAPKINFTDFDINKALENNTFSFDKIDIKNPNIKIEINDSVKGDKLDFIQNLDLYPYTEPYVNQISVKNLNLSNVDLNFNLFEKQLINKKINLRFNNILIAENQPPSNLLNSKEFEITTTNFRRTDKNELYEFTIDSLIYNSAKHNVMFKDFKVNPLVSSEEMVRRNGFQTDVVNAKVDYIELMGIDEKRWIKENILDAGIFKIGKSEMEIYRNKRYPFNQNQRPPWPQDLIKKIKQPFVFDSVILVPSYLKYSELLDFSDEPGFIEFNNLQLNAGRISNIQSVRNNTKNFRINASAMLLNQAQLSATINFDLTSPVYEHTVSGSLNEMPLSPLNVMVEKAAPVSIESGHLNRFKFDMKLDNTSAEGKLWFAYDNFKISILEYGNNEVKKSRLASFWANKMMLNSKNPKGDKLLPETISYERDRQRSIINYWWKAIYSSAKKTIGLKTNEE